jgi:hypothetical protein
MAGHRRATGKPRRADRRDEHWRQQIGSAPDARWQFIRMSNLVLARAKKAGDPGALLNAASRALGEVIGRHG